MLTFAIILGIVGILCLLPPRKKEEDTDVGTE